MRELSPNTPPRRGRSLWVEALFHPTVWRRASLIGIPVGILQAAINQGDIWLRHAADGVVVAKTIASPCVAFGIALTSTAWAYVERKREGEK